MYTPFGIVNKLSYFNHLLAWCLVDNFYKYIPVEMFYLNIEFMAFVGLVIQAYAYTFVVDWLSGLRNLSVSAMELSASKTTCCWLIFLIIRMSDPFLIKQKQM